MEVLLCLSVHHVVYVLGKEDAIDALLQSKIDVVLGDIIHQATDCIVVSAASYPKQSLVKGQLRSFISEHRELAAELDKFSTPGFGEVVVTNAYGLAAKRMIHTVGPAFEMPNSTALLRNCYTNSLEAMKDETLRSISFPVISTGNKEYPLEKAAHVAIDAVRSWMEEYVDNVDKVVFVLYPYNGNEYALYERLIPEYFPGFDKLRDSRGRTNLSRANAFGK